jgi:hypothetical protein
VSDSAPREPAITSTWANYKGIISASQWLTPRRIRAQAIVFALCLWGVCAVDYATSGVFDRGGNIKFQDFVVFRNAARLIAEGRARELYDDDVLATGVHAIAGRQTTVRLQYFYGPQVSLPFLPLLRFSFLTQAGIWIALSFLMYFGSVYLLWKTCRGLRPYAGLVALCAFAYPPLFSFFVRGQLSAVVLICVTCAFLAFVKRRDWLAGIALGFLIFKPQFLAAIPLVLLLAKSWKALAGLTVAASGQLLVTLAYFGHDVMRLYVRMLLHSASTPAATELSLSPIQMHSLRAFWVLLIPWPPAFWMAYALSSLAVIAVAAAVWKSASPLPLRFSVLVLAAVLVNPHLFIYDLLALVPALLLLADWAIDNAESASIPALRLLLYLAFVLPFFGPLSRWTHLQPSVVAFAALLWLLWRLSRETAKTGSHELASHESTVV